MKMKMILAPMMLREEKEIMGVRRIVFFFLQRQ